MRSKHQGHCPAATNLPKELRRRRPETARGQASREGALVHWVETRGPSLPGQKTQGTRTGPRPVVSQWQGTAKGHPHPRVCSILSLGRPGLWGAGRTGFCQDKHKRVREDVSVINRCHPPAALGVPRPRLSHCLAVMRRSSFGDCHWEPDLPKEITSTLTCPRSALASRRRTQLSLLPQTH